MGDGGLRDIISKPAWIVIVGASRLRETETLNQIILVCWGLAPIPPNNKNNTKRQSGRSFVFVGWVPFRILLAGGRAGTSSFWYVRGHPCVFYAQRPTCNVIPAGVRGQKVCLICGEGRRIAHARPYTLEKIDRTCNLFE